ncbi:MAG: hypothetical protein J6T70_06075 [Bacteroidales bacterium]|nr:hypothetical protein [Bacteroidales bacterium]
MKNKLLFLIIFISIINYCYSQVSLSASDLLFLIKSRGGVFEVVEKANINRGGFENILDDSLQGVFNFNDYENAYHNQELKKELLHLLNDTISYAKMYSNDRIYKVYTMDAEYTRNKVSGWLSAFCKQKKDTIMKTESLFKHYRDSLIMAESNKYYNNALHNFKISKYTKEFLTRLKYPEVYLAFYKKWEQDGKTFDSEWFKYLLDFQDPEAEKLFQDSFEEAILSKKESLFLDFKNYISYHFNSFATSQFIRILDKTDFVEEQMMDFEVPIYVTFFSAVDNVYLDWLMFENAYLANLFWKVGDFAYSNKIDKAIKEYNKIKPELLVFYKEMLKFNRQEELYWKQNMPYYKKE